MKKILLTGAAGSIGYETLKQLITTNHEITVLDLPTKNNKNKLEPLKNQITIIYGNINNEETIKHAIKNKDIIIHLAAIIPPLADKNPELTRQINYFGTLNIIKQIKSTNKNCFLIYSSSVSVYGDRINNPWIKVSDPLKASYSDYYAYTKIETEKLIKSSHINYTIFRLTGIMGHPKTDPLMFHMPLNTKIEIATTKDTAKAFVNAIEKTKELNHNTYNLGGGKQCRTTYQDFLTNMFKIYGLNIKFMKERAFAEKNFHCGYFLDSDKLNKILNFQTDTLKSYYDRIKKETKKPFHNISVILSRPIMYFLNKSSEPLQARKKSDKNLIYRFFKKDK
ncbi:MAG: NAD(P)-dependent oxidoreductase [Bacilli bacterium]